MVDLSEMFPVDQLVLESKSFTEAPPNVSILFNMYFFNLKIRNINKLSCFSCFVDPYEKVWFWFTEQYVLRTGDDCALKKIRSIFTLYVFVPLDRACKRNRCLHLSEQLTNRNISAM